MATLAPGPARHFGDAAPVAKGHSAIRRLDPLASFTVSNCAHEGDAIVLVELGLVEQRYKAVLEVLEDGGSVTDVRPTLWRGPPGCAQLAPALCPRGPRRSG